MHANEELIRKGFAAFNSGDAATLASVFSEDVVWRPAGQGRLAGAKEGLAATMGYFGQLAEGSGGTLRADLKDVLADDSHAYTLHHGTASHNGRSLTLDVVIAFTIAGGVVTAAQEHLTDTTAWDEFFA